MLIRDFSKYVSVYIGSLKFGGDKDIRTPDLLRAKQALYQLSYIPINR